MSYSRGRDFLFCDMCGTLLSLNSSKHGDCQLCGCKHAAKDIINRETSYTVTAEDIRRDLGIEPFVILDGINTDEGSVQRAVVNEPCPRCHHPQLEYYTKQLRSADEGQTVFYECPKCRHKFSINT
ncbi:DNA-directed RNA polymerase I subunit RPA12-like isoform X1 [Macadamia integrifolia]|uniref:DNA-directed RNA polymerase I subunit RPA12-like isoform X1 n=1 Tax=Macadamia integrifolia TaxID=60698 RepID=UPI001C4EFD12|nr:DNA-directed RNA polymerase I subunit RPA12-like isoform X1 [Macadamia integrifolia]